MNNSGNDPSSISTSRIVRTTYKAPQFYASAISRRLSHSSDVTISAGDKIKLDFLNNLQYLQRQYERRATAAAAAGNHSSNRSMIMNSKSSHHPSTSNESLPTEEEKYSIALKLFHTHPCVIQYLLASSRREHIAQHYCWPILPSNPLSEGYRQANRLKRQQHYNHSIYDPTTTETDTDSSLDAYYALSDQVKSFLPEVKGSQVNWRENFHILYRKKVIEKDVRNPPTFFREMVRDSLHYLEDCVIEIPRPKMKKQQEIAASSSSKERLLEATLHHIPVTNQEILQYVIQKGEKKYSAQQFIYQALPIMEDKEMKRAYLQQPPSSLGAEQSITEEQKKSLKIQSLELMLGRQLEGMTDAVLEMMFQSFSPLIKAANDDNGKDGTSKEEGSVPTKQTKKRKLNSNEPDTEEGEEDEKKQGQNNKEQKGTEGEGHPLVLHGKKDPEEYYIKSRKGARSDKLSVAIKRKGSRVKHRLRLEMTNTTTKALDQQQQEGEEEDEAVLAEDEHGKLTQDEIRLKQAMLDRLKMMDKLPTSGAGQIHWDHVISALEVSDLMKRLKQSQLQIHPELPALPLTAEVIDRVKYRLLALHGQPIPAEMMTGNSSGNSMKETPTILATDLEKKKRKATTSL